MSKVTRWKSHGINGKSDGSFGTFDTFDQSGISPALSFLLKMNQMQAVSLN